MENQTLSVESRIKLVWNSVLEADNHIVGLFICVFAVIDWTAVYDGIEPLKIYFSQGIYTVPSLSALNKFFSAVYLTLAAIILLSLRPPLSRYQTALPNLVAVLAAFAVYIFVYVPQGNLFHTNIAVALALIVSGAILVIGALIFLRQAFTVTPQARFLVTAGPYSIVRHPMYVGNIVSILGLALLIDSLQAVLLFLLCSGLQAGRALYEERLLAAQFPQYAEYKTKVGRFFPRLTPKRLTSVSVCGFALLLQPCQPVQAAAASGTPSYFLLDNSDHAGSASDKRVDNIDVILADSNGYGVVRVASQPNYAGKCSAWSRKATTGQLFSADELADMAMAEVPDTPGSNSAACSAFFSLRSSCQATDDKWNDNEISDVDFISKLKETSPGCEVLEAADSCKALKKIVRRGVPLASDDLDFFAQCARVEVINRRFEQIRPAM